jgi:hypothetical protein
VTTLTWWALHAHASISAAGLENGEQPGSHLGLGAALAIYLAIPAGLFAIISLLVVLPNLVRRPRYRPGRPWPHAPVWFAGPDQPDAAVRSAVPALQARGGASAEW